MMRSELVVEAGLRHDPMQQTLAALEAAAEIHHDTAFVYAALGDIDRGARASQAAVLAEHYAEAVRHCITERWY
jgi:hypothetical protein